MPAARRRTGNGTPPSSWRTIHVDRRRCICGRMPLPMVRSANAEMVVRSRTSTVGRIRGPSSALSSSPKSIVSKSMRTGISRANSPRIVTTMASGRTSTSDLSMRSSSFGRSPAPQPRATSRRRMADGPRSTRWPRIHGCHAGPSASKGRRPSSCHTARCSNRLQSR